MTSSSSCLNKRISPVFAGVPNKGQLDFLGKKCTLLFPPVLFLTVHFWKTFKKFKESHTIAHCRWSLLVCALWWSVIKGWTHCCLMCLWACRPEWGRLAFMSCWHGMLSREGLQESYFFPFLFCFPLLCTEFLLVKICTWNVYAQIFALNWVGKKRVLYVFLFDNCA